MVSVRIGYRQMNSNFDYLFDRVVTGPPPIIFTIMMVKSFSYFVTVVLVILSTHQVEKGSFSLGCAAASQRREKEN